MRSEDDKFKVPVGIGGWLLIPFWSLILQSYLQGREFFLSYVPLLLSSDFWLYFNSDYEMFNPTYGFLKVFEAAMSFFLMIWSAICVYLILKKSSLTRKSCCWYFITCCVYPILEGVFASSCIDGYQILPEGNGAVTALVLLLGPALWALYFIKSKRVINTFNRSNRDKCIHREVLTPEEESKVSMLLFRRAGARILDFAVVVLCACVACGIRSVKHVVFWSPFWSPWFVMYFLVLDLVLYAFFKQTPGKYLFRLGVIRKDGRPLTRKEYMFRSGNALFFLGWPFFALCSHPTMRHFWLFGIMSVVATFSYQYCKVLSFGSTSYDAVYDTKVVGQKMSVKQLSLAIFVLFGIYALLAYIAMG